MIEVSINTEVQEDLYKQINSTLGNDVLLCDVLREKLQHAEISEEALMEWARYVKLASESAVKISELEGFAVAKILRSWRSIQGIIRLGV